MDSGRIVKYTFVPVIEFIVNDGKVYQRVAPGTPAVTPDGEKIVVEESVLYEITETGSYLKMADGTFVRFMPDSQDFQKDMVG